MRRYQRSIEYKPEYQAYLVTYYYSNKDINYRFDCIANKDSLKCYGFKKNIVKEAYHALDRVRK